MSTVSPSFSLSPYFSGPNFGLSPVPELLSPASMELIINSSTFSPGRITPLATPTQTYLAPVPASPQYTQAYVSALAALQLSQVKQLSAGSGAAPAQNGIHAQTVKSLVVNLPTQENPYKLNNQSRTPIPAVLSPPHQMGISTAMYLPNNRINHPPKPNIPVNPVQGLSPATLAMLASVGRK